MSGKIIITGVVYGGSLQSAYDSSTNPIVVTNSSTGAITFVTNEQEMKEKIELRNKKLDSLWQEK